MKNLPGFIVVLDYGMGSLIACMTAGSTDDIRAMYPELAVYEEPPLWIDEQQLARIVEGSLVDIQDTDDEFVRAVMAARSAE